MSEFTATKRERGLHSLDSAFFFLLFLLFSSVSTLLLFAARQRPRLIANRAGLEYHRLQPKYLPLVPYSTLFFFSFFFSLDYYPGMRMPISPTCDLPEPEAVPTYLILAISILPIILPIMRSSRQIPPPAFFSVVCENRGCSTLLCLLLTAAIATTTTTTTTTTSIQPFLDPPLARRSLVCLVILLVLCQPPSPFLRPRSTLSSGDLRRPVPLLGLRGLLPLLHPSRMPDQIRSLLSPIRLLWNRL